MKKLLSLILCLILCLSLLACNSEGARTTVGGKTTKQTEGTKATQPSQPADSETEDDDSNTTTPKPLVPGIDIPDLSSHTETEIKLVDGKIQLNEKVICATLCYGEYIHPYENSECEYSTIILQQHYDIGKVRQAIENLTFVKEPNSINPNFITNTCDVNIYFDNGTYISFSMSKNGRCFTVNQIQYFSEFVVQGSNLLAAFRVPNIATDSFVNEHISIDEGHMSFKRTITKLKIRQNDYIEEVCDLKTKIIEYSDENTEAGLLDDLATFFENIKLGTPANVNTPPVATYDFLEFEFYSVDTQNRSDSCYVVIRLFKVDGVHYFKINKNCYAVEDSVIEELYNQLTFSIQ